MSNRASRGWICAVALLAAALFGFGALLLLLQHVCDDVDPATLQTVRCDGERGRWWVLAQGALVVTGAVALLAGIVRALAMARMVALAAAIALDVVLLVAAYAISGIGLADKPVPRLSGVRVIERRCAEPCAGGVRVRFALDRAAPVRFSLGPESNASVEVRPYRRLDYQYRTGVLSRAGTTAREEIDFAAGRHLVRVGGIVEIAGPPVRRESLPPGVYVLRIEALVPGAGNQLRNTSAPVSRGIRILPRR